jgi:IclR family acetate operon transcriptional repressor
MLPAPVAASSVRSLDRAVAVLDAFRERRGEMGVSEMARATGLSRSTAHRLLASLEVHGLVQQLPASGRYALGPHLLRLAHAVDPTTAHVSLQTFARPVMERLRDHCDETVGLHVRVSPTARAVVDQVESRQPLRRTYTDLGQPIPIHEGAPGKLLLALSPEGVRERVLGGALERATERTITAAAELRAELERIRAAGYALSLEERVAGVFGLAVPVRDFTGNAVAALSVSGPSSRLTEERLRALAPEALRAGAELSASLGWSPPEAQ